jgi:hypothetical protein
MEQAALIISSLENLEGRDHSEDLTMDARILQWILEI